VNGRPPAVARWLAARLIPPAEREFVIGDMDELFQRNAATLSPSRARALYWRQALGLARHRIRPAYTPTTTKGTIDMTSFWRDLIVGARTAWHMRTYSAITILTLALAIGANTLIFSIANPIAVRALPIVKPDGLAWIQTVNLPRKIERGQVSVPDFVEFRERASSFSSLAAYKMTSGTLSGHQQDPEHVTMLLGTGNFTEVWGMKPALGRVFRPDDAEPGRPASAVLSTRYWRERFQQDPGVIGRQFLLNNAPVVVIGVMPADLEIGNLSLIDLWMPMALDPAAPRDARTLRVLGRLAPGKTLEQAQAEVQAIGDQKAAAHPESSKDWQARALSTRAAMTSKNTWIVLLLLSIVVGFVLLIACANLANLVMARLTARRLDLAVRQALGASRWQLIRPLMSESLILSILGGALGLALAQGGLRIVNAVAYEPYFKTLGIDANVLIFAAVISVLTPLLFCLWPAISAGRSVTAETLRDSRTSGARSVRTRRNVLVVAQVALALSLLVMSALAVRSMRYLHSLDVGLDMSRMAMFRVDFPDDRYGSDDARARVAETIAERASRIGGVDAAAVISSLPYFDGEATRQVEGLATQTSEHDRPWVAWYSVTPGYFRAAGVGVIAGRAFADSDRAGTEPVAVINRLAAERYFGDIGAAVGRQIVLTSGNEPKRPVTVIGVAADTLSPMLLVTSPQAYVPFAQWPTASVSVITHSDAPASRLSDMRAVMRGIDSTIPITDLRTMADRNADENSSDQILNGLFISFALLALVLASGGLYGVISYSVGQRTREIGVRMALGAAPAGISRMVLIEGMKVIGVGIAAGLLLGVAIAKIASPILEGVSPTDPATFLVVTAAVLAVAVASILGPAVRAMRMSPARTLRAD
jgi:putative ABC transport system permease protein